MIQRLREWFNGIEKSSSVDKDDRLLHSSLAVVFYHVIKADEQITEKERERFQRFFTKSVHLSDEAVERLYSSMESFDESLEEHLKVLQEKLKSLPQLKIQIMHEINSLIQSDGIDDREYQVFEKVRKELL